MLQTVISRSTWMKLNRTEMVLMECLHRLSHIKDIKSTAEEMRKELQRLISSSLSVHSASAFYEAFIHA